MHRVTGAGSKRSKPVHPALQTGSLDKTRVRTDPRFDVERRGRRVEIIEIRLNAEDERATAALPIIANIPAKRDPALAVFKISSERLVVDVNSLAPIA